MFGGLSATLNNTPLERCYPPRVASLLNKSWRKQAAAQGQPARGAASVGSHPSSCPKPRTPRR
eukprot:16168472-Heterocapsa_arctica.AAC.1